MGGHLTALRRTRVGPFEVQDAGELDTLDPGAALIPAAQAATELFERLELTEQQAIDLTHGRRIHVADREGASAYPSRPSPRAARWSDSSSSAERKPGRS